MTTHEDIIDSPFDGTFEPGKQVTSDPANDYTERTGRYLSLRERMAERSLFSVGAADEVVF